MPDDKPTIEPCPFCAGEFGLQPPNKPTMAVHPGQQADGSCALAGFVFHGERMKLLNKRPKNVAFIRDPLNPTAAPDEVELPGSEDDGAPQG